MAVSAGCGFTGRNEAIAPAADSLDVPLRLARIAQGFAGLCHSVRQPVVGRELVRIQLLHQLLRGHGAAGMLDEVGNKSKTRGSSGTSFPAWRSS